MEVAPQELAALLKLAGVGSDPEPEMVAQPQVSAIAIPSEDEAPTGGCGGGRRRRRRRGRRRRRRRRGGRRRRRRIRLLRRRLRFRLGWFCMAGVRKSDV